MNTTDTSGMNLRLRQLGFCLAVFGCACFLTYICALPWLAPPMHDPPRLQYDVIIAIGQKTGSSSFDEAMQHLGYKGSHGGAGAGTWWDCGTINRVCEPDAPLVFSGTPSIGAECAKEIIAKCKRPIFIELQRNQDDWARSKREHYMRHGTVMSLERVKKQWARNKAENDRAAKIINGTAPWIRLHLVEDPINSAYTFASDVLGWDETEARKFQWPHANAANTTTNTIALWFWAVHSRHYDLAVTSVMFMCGCICACFRMRGSMQFRACTEGHILNSDGRTVPTPIGILMAISNTSDAALHSRKSALEYLPVVNLEMQPSREGAQQTLPQGMSLN